MLFSAGFSHGRNVDLNSVRLCFQAYLRGPDGKYTIPVTPVVSQPIYDKSKLQVFFIIFIIEIFVCLFDYVNVCSVFRG